MYIYYSCPQSSITRPNSKIVHAELVIRLLPVTLRLDRVKVNSIQIKTK